mgnify:CR=1 FL=1
MTTKCSVSPFFFRMTTICEKERKKTCHSSMILPIMRCITWTFNMDMFAWSSCTTLRMVMFVVCNSIHRHIVTFSFHEKSMIELHDNSAIHFSQKYCITCGHLSLARLYSIYVLHYLWSCWSGTVSYTHLRAHETS